MIWIILIFLIILFLLFYPFKITIFNNEKYLYIKISNIITLKLNLYALLDEENKEELKKQTKAIKLINKLKFKEISIYIRGINYNYEINGLYYGLLHAILPIANSILETNNIDFNYLIDYNGDPYIKFKSVVKGRLKNVLTAFYGI
jgi:hypothetical protein